MHSTGLFFEKALISLSKLFKTLVKGFKNFLQDVSKAAQNMLLKTAAIELQRSRKQNICVGLHPGTVATPLSAPFSSKVGHAIFTPQDSAEYLFRVLSQPGPEETGKCFAWDGTEVLP